MATKFTKNAVRSTKTNIEASGFWLNTRIDGAATIGTSLARGMRGHDNLIAIIEKYGIDKTNRWLKSKGIDAYVNQAGETFEIDSLDNEFANI